MKKCFSLALLHSKDGLNTTHIYSLHLCLLLPTLSLLHNKYIYFCIKYSHYFFTPHYHVYDFTSMLIPHYIIYLFGLHIYCTWVVKFSLTHKQTSKHILFINLYSVKVFTCFPFVQCSFSNCLISALCGLHFNTQFLPNVFFLQSFALFLSNDSRYQSPHHKCTIKKKREKINKIK